MRRTGRMIARGGVALLAVLLAAGSSLTAQVRQLGLREMVASAGTIFIGTVSGARGGTDEHGDIVTYTTFTVEEPIYGVAGRSITIKQLGGETSTISARLEHMRYFRPGERVLVMLYPTSKLGFTSPVGLNQGAWPVTTSGLITGVSGEALEGLGAVLRKYGASSQGNGSIGRSAFVAVIGDLLKEVKR